MTDTSIEDTIEVEAPVADLTYADGLREAADWLDAHPLFHVQLKWHHRDINIFPSTEEWVPLLEEMGSFDKHSDDYNLTALKKINEFVSMRIIKGHEGVCEQVKTGTEQVITMVPPEGVELVEEITVKDTFEWVCPDRWKEAIPDGNRDS